MKKSIIRDNRGVSLIEMMIVVALITLMAGVMGYGISLIASKPAQQCAQKIMYSVERNRVRSMGSLSSELKFYMNGDKVYVVEAVERNQTSGLVNSNPSEIGDKVTVVVTFADGSTKDLSTYSSSSPLVVEFTRDSGSLKQTGSTYVKSFTVSKSGKVHTVSIERLTGKVTMQ